MAHQDDVAKGGVSPVHWNVQYENVNDKFIAPEVIAARQLLATLERLEPGATLDDLRELLKADIVEAALVKGPYQKSELPEFKPFIGPLDQPTTIATSEEFAKLFGPKDLK